MAKSGVSDAVNFILGNARQVESLVVIVGAGVSVGAGEPDWRGLIRQQYLRTLEGARVARPGQEREAAENQLSREMAELLRNAVPTHPTASTPIHEALAKLAPRAIVTTNYDNLIEIALREAGRQPIVITGTSGLMEPAEDSVPVYKIHGSIDEPLSLDEPLNLVMTAEDSEAYKGRLYDRALRNIFVVSVVIVVGFTLRGDELGALYERFGGDAYLQDWFVLATETDPELDPVSESLWRHRGVRVLRVHATDVPGILDALRRRRELDAGKAAPPGRSQVFVSMSSGDDEVALAVRQILENLGLVVVGATDAAKPGKTILETFDQVVDSSGAALVVIGPEGGPGHLMRSRQNLIFELGYLIGRLGRERVIGIVTEGAEIPSDLAGISFLVADLNRPDTLEIGLRRWALASGLPVEG
jgi:hypothetical protein